MPEGNKPEDLPEPGDASWDDQVEMIREAQRVYVERQFKWLIDYITAYFPEDKLVAEDVVTDVHFLHSVVEQGKMLGVLVYRLRKAPDKKAYFEEMAGEIREELGGAEVLFVDTETSRFQAPDPLPKGEPYVEIPAEGLTGRIRELRDELKSRAKMRSLRDSLGS